ncbi:MAG TPA: hypothetical protein GXZ66_02945, partial [Clostridiaceae bacterium]|nr:hypothetical protein [Clostridiaceae bacterium]
EIPLVYGYTMWYKAHWTNYREPFVSNKELLNLLKSTLHLSEAGAVCVVIIIAAVIATVLMINKNKNKKS